MTKAKKIGLIIGIIAGAVLTLAIIVICAFSAIRTMSNTAAFIDRAEEYLSETMVADNIDGDYVSYHKNGNAYYCCAEVYVWVDGERYIVYFERDSADAEWELLYAEKDPDDWKTSNRSDTTRE